MKAKHVYIINSIQEKTFMVFGTEKRAKEWIEKRFNKDIFTESCKEDLYISKRVIF